jgi:hypothetical protein
LPAIPSAQRSSALHEGPEGFSIESVYEPIDP